MEARQGIASYFGRKQNYLSIEAKWKIKVYYKAGVKRRTSHEPNRMLMKLNEGAQRVFLICIRFSPCEVRRLTRA